MRTKDQDQTNRKLEWLVDRPSRMETEDSDNSQKLPWTWCSFIYMKHYETGETCRL